jgi:guanosine-3',5'-bis(diphosphate) 3'-pyrophosphohydrolase
MVEEFAKKKHRHMVRKDGKTLYWVHLQQVVDNLVAIGIADEEILCAGWLHDTIEDTDTDFDEIKEEFGSEVARIVADVTKDKRLPEDKRENEYAAQLRAASWKAHVVKLCDIWANVADIPSGYKEYQKQAEQVKKKLVYFEAIRKGLLENREKIPYLDKGLDELNAMLAHYGKAIRL